MEIVTVGSRGFLVGFEDPYETYIYVMLGEHTRYVCDTFLGPEPINEALKLLENEGVSRESTVVFNTHSDYDHHWGNCAFRGNMILGHDLCRRTILEKGERALRVYESHKRGDVEIVPPNVTFDRSIAFPDDGVRFWHTPGHTADSCSCFDEIDRVLVVGDNIEHPIPFVNDCHFDDYISTLHSYLDLGWGVMVTGHSAIHTNTQLLMENLFYLEDLSRWQTDIIEMSQEKRSVHVSNLVRISSQLLELNPGEEVFDHYRQVLEALRSQGPSSDNRDAIEAITLFLEKASQLRT